MALTIWSRANYTARNNQAYLSKNLCMDFIAITFFAKKGEDSKWSRCAIRISEVRYTSKNGVWFGNADICPNMDDLLKYAAWVYSKFILVRLYKMSVKEKSGETASVVTQWLGN